MIHFRMRAVDQSDGRTESQYDGGFLPDFSGTVCVCVCVCVILVQTSSITGVLDKKTFIVSTEGQSSGVA